MIGIGTRIGREWLTDANDLHFLKQIGVDSVDVDFGIFEGYVESGGVLRKDALAAVVERLGAAGLRIERANYLSRELNPVYLDGPGASKAIDSVRRAIECLGEFDVPIMGLQRFEASSVLGRSAGVHSWQAGRGGYRYLHIDLRGEFPPAAPPVGAPTREELWERTIGLYLDLIPVAEGAGVKLAEHGNDPPLPSVGGVPQIFCSFADFERLFAEAPSDSVGMTFCVGTRYESGEDLFEGIRRFVGRGKVFHVHFRNVRGTVPVDRAYSEVAPDDGDLNMLEVVRELARAGYGGVIDYDHVMRLSGDGPEGRDYVTFCVGYMKGLLAAVQ